jgi:tRNA(Ile)-lysidine synthase
MIDWKHKNNPPASSSSSSDSVLPDAILSLHVDHNLQSDAEKMAYAARRAATRFKAAAHAELRVPWGSPSFPPHPRAPTVAGEDEAAASTTIESVARTARYRLMFDAMTKGMTTSMDMHQHQHRVDVVRVLATGHHADDQVETVLMRLGAGSSVLGLGGMRPVRRFGMAMGNKAGSGSGEGEGEGEKDFGWFGHEGLDRWIVRPLLDVSKVSQTCSLSLSRLNDITQLVS